MWQLARHRAVFCFKENAKQGSAQTTRRGRIKPASIPFENDKITRQGDELRTKYVNF